MRRARRDRCHRLRCLRTRRHRQRSRQRCDLRGRSGRFEKLTVARELVAQQNLPRIDVRGLEPTALDVGVELQSEDPRADRIAGAERDLDVARPSISVAMRDWYDEAHDEHAVAVLFEAGRALDCQGGVSLKWSPGKCKKPCKSLTYKAFRYWWRFRDSNPGPADYDSVALTG